MADTGRMVSSIESDRARGPWVEFWGDWLHRVDVPERALALPPGDVCSIYHVHRFDLRGKLLLSPCVQWPRLFVIVLALRSLFPVFGVSFFGMFENPALSICMIRRLVRGAINQAWTIKYAVQAG